MVFVGDVIFAGSIGRTDFPDGDHRQLIFGIRSKLFTLPDETILLPGHGEVTTVARKNKTIRSWDCRSVEVIACWVPCPRLPWACVSRERTCHIAT